MNTTTIVIIVIFIVLIALVLISTVRYIKKRQKYKEKFKKDHDIKLCWYCEEELTPEQDHCPYCGRKQ